MINGFAIFHAPIADDASRMGCFILFETYATVHRMQVATDL